MNKTFLGEVTREACVYADMVPRLMENMEILTMGFYICVFYRPGEVINLIKSFLKSIIV